MGARIDIGTHAITAKVDGVVERVLPIFTDIVRQDSDYFAKVDQGTMRDTSATASDFENGIIIYNTKYAKRQYYTMRALRNVNPHASRKWFHVAKQRKMDDWTDQAQALIDGRG
jgi:hypothetical protein